MAKDLHAPHDSWGSLVKRRFFAGLSKVLYWHAFTGGAGQAFRTAIFRAAGGYSSARWNYVLQDHEIISRIHKLGRTVYHPDHWCMPSNRRGDRTSVSWTRAEQTLYFLTPPFGQDWLFNRFLARRFAARQMDQLKLREQTWQEADAGGRKPEPRPETGVRRLPDALDSMFRESTAAVMRFKQLLSDLVTFSRSARAQRCLKLASPIFLVGIGALLAYQLTRIGWSDMSRSIPTSPWFYLLFLVFYLAQPGFDALIFARIWHCGFWRLLPPACLKHVCNQDVMELSGEVYFYIWSTRRLGLNPGQALRTIKDVTILSAIVGYVVMLALPPLCLWLGLLGPRQGLTPRETLLIGYGAPAALCGIAAVVIGARRAIFFSAGKHRWK